MKATQCHLLQEYSPLLGQAGNRGRAHQEDRRTAALKDQWLTKVPVAYSLALITRVVRLIFSLMTGLVGNKTAFEKRTHLANSAQPAAGDGSCACAKCDSDLAP